MGRPLIIVRVSAARNRTQSGSRASIFEDFSPTHEEVNSSIGHGKKRARIERVYCTYRGNTVYRGVPHVPGTIAPVSRTLADVYNYPLEPRLAAQLSISVCGDLFSPISRFVCIYIYISRRIVFLHVFPRRTTSTSAS